MSNDSIQSNELEVFKFPKLVLEQTLYTLSHLKMQRLTFRILPLQGVPMWENLH